MVLKMVFCICENNVESAFSVQMWELFRHLGFESFRQIFKAEINSGKILYVISFKSCLGFHTKTRVFFKVTRTGLCLPFQIQATEFQSLLLHHTE